MGDTPRVEVHKLTDVVPDDQNANKHTKRGMATVERSLRNRGFFRPTAAFGKGVDKPVMGAGNLTQETALGIGMEDAIFIYTDGTKPIVHVRTDIEPGSPEAQALAIEDNRSAELSLSWDVPTLLTMPEAVIGELWEPAELEQLGDAWAGEHGEKPELPTANSGTVYSNEQIIDAAFAYFRKTGFPYRNLPVHVCMQEVNKLAATEPEKLLHSDTAYHVADTYHPHRFHAAAANMKSPFEAFNDDKLLRRSVSIILEQGRYVPDGFWDGLKIVSGTQMCSNFRPGFASLLYRQYCQSGYTVLDTSTGYGGRLVGFMASGIAGRYIGIDPNKPTHEGNTRMAADLGFAEKVELINLPAEDVPHETVAGRCDFAFTSPPYFSKEHYSEDDTQSWVRYKTGEDWRQGFLLPMLALQFAALKPGCFAIVNIADVKIKSKSYPLADWTKEAGQQVGFEYVRMDKFELTRRFGAGQDDEVASEPVIVLRKPDDGRQ